MFNVYLNKVAHRWNNVVPLILQYIFKIKAKIYIVLCIKHIYPN